jgi:DNA-binding beta-propeller fold protein YncE
MLSPKSVNFSPDGTQVYINALEAYTTLVYSFPDLRETARIQHTFTKEDAHLFHGESTIFDYQYYKQPPEGHPNIFSGKPVEAAFSHQGRYLWVPYYRRSFDVTASSPSAVAIIDTQSNTIVRVMPTGPLPKVVAVAPDDSLAAIVHWGDNTVGIIDISGGDPAGFKYVDHLVVGRRLATQNIQGNRDSNCGYCLRGTVFTLDGKHLLVGRMGGGGITCFAMPQGTLLGSVVGLDYAPRHLALDPAGHYLYASNNRQGLIARVLLADFLTAVADAEGGSVSGPVAEVLSVGSGARTIAVSPDGKSLYAAVNLASELVRVDLDAWRVVQRTPVSPFPVGLGLSPDGTHVAVTSQGRSGGGGNSVEFFAIHEP